jgi:hypothetical protein
MNATTTDTAFDGIVAAWDEPLICESLYGCPNTATWLAVHHCTDRNVVSDWHMKRWLREKWLIITKYGYVKCDCGLHCTKPESCIAFTPL